MSNVIEILEKNNIDLYSILIPLGYGSVKLLEDLGFKFTSDIIRYDYQNEPIFYRRIQKLINEIESISQKFSLSEISDKIKANEETMQHNYNYIVSGKLFENAKDKLIVQLFGYK